MNKSKKITAQKTTTTTWQPAFFCQPAKKTLLPVLLPWQVFLFWAVLMAFFLPSLVFAKLPADREQFLDFFEIMQLVSKAKNAGYSNEQLENLSLKDGWQNIELKNVGLAYDRFLAERAQKPSFVLEKLPPIPFAPQVDLLAFLLNLLEKKPASPAYFTLQDVMADLQKNDQTQLSLLNGQNNAATAHITLQATK